MNWYIEKIKLKATAVGGMVNAKSAAGVTMCIEKNLLTRPVGSIGVADVSVAEPQNVQFRI